MAVDYSKVCVPTNLYNGEWVEVEGNFNATGDVLTARKVEHEYPDYDD